MPSLALSKVLLVAGTAALALCACGNSKEVAFDSGGVKHVFTAGESTTTAGFILPIYPNAVTNGAVQASGDADDASKFMMLNSTDSVEKIRTFYLDKLKSEGWVVAESLHQPTLVNIGVSKEQLDGSVMLSADADGKTTITLAVGRHSDEVPKVSDETFTPDKMNPPTD